METKNIPDVPLLRVLPGLYRALLRITRRHGMFTIARNHVRLYPRGQRVKIAGDATLYLPPDPHFIGFLLGTHEQHIAALMMEHVRAGDVCADVGANIGYFTAVLSTLAGPTGRVLSFEPVPENFQILAINARIASQHGAVVQTWQAAVSAAPGELRIVRQAHSTAHQVTAAPGASTEIVPSISLDAELPKQIGASQIAFLKVDVEGHELSVLQGMRELIHQGKIRRMVMEVTPGPDATQISEIIATRPHKLTTWCGKSWQHVGISELTERTDVFVEFQTP